MLLSNTTTSLTCDLPCPLPIIPPDVYHDTYLISVVGGWLSFVASSYLLLTTLIFPKNRAWPRRIVASLAFSTLAGAVPFIGNSFLSLTAFLCDGKPVLSFSLPNPSLNAPASGASAWCVAQAYLIIVPGVWATFWMAVYAFHIYYSVSQISSTSSPSNPPPSAFFSSTSAGSPYSSSAPFYNTIQNSSPSHSSSSSTFPPNFPPPSHHQNRIHPQSPSLLPTSPSPPPLPSPSPTSSSSFSSSSSLDLSSQHLEKWYHLAGWTPGVLVGIVCASFDLLGPGIGVPFCFTRWTDPWRDVWGCFHGLNFTVMLFVTAFVLAAYLRILRRPDSSSGKRSTRSHLLRLAAYLGVCWLFTALLLACLVQLESHSGAAQTSLERYCACSAQGFQDCEFPMMQSTFVLYGNSFAASFGGLVLGLIFGTAPSNVRLWAHALCGRRRAWEQSEVEGEVMLHSSEVKSYASDHSSTHHSDVLSEYSVYHSSHSEQYLTDEGNES